MKNKKLLFLFLPVFAMLSGCSKSGSCSMANEILFDLDGITEIFISYDEENINFYQAESDELVVKEYMSENKSSYYAKSVKQGSVIRISEGGKPVFKNDFKRYIEVYLPSEFDGDLSVSTTNGEIDYSDMEVCLNSLYMETTSGKISADSVSAPSIRLATTSGEIRCGALAAEQICLESTSGRIFCGELTAEELFIASTSGETQIDRLSGYVEYVSTKGSLCVKSATGGGSYRAENSGNIELYYTNPESNISVYNKNGSILFRISEACSFEMEATAKNGRISFSDTIEYDIQGKSYFAKTGENPNARIRLETSNGAIEVER